MKTTGDYDREIEAYRRDHAAALARSDSFHAWRDAGMPQSQPEASRATSDDAEVSYQLAMLVHYREQSRRRTTVADALASALPAITNAIADAITSTRAEAINDVALNGCPHGCTPPCPFTERLASLAT